MKLRTWRPLLSRRKQVSPPALPLTCQGAAQPAKLKQAETMNPHPFLGVFFHWLGGLASGSFYVPYRGVKKWSWENCWLAGGIFAWIVCPWTLAFLMTNDLAGVLKQQTAGAIWWTYFFGLLWGFGGL